MIYKITDCKTWQAATEAGIFHGAEVDVRDGFIHFSAADQVKETARRHFHGQTDLLLIEFEESDFGERLKWETSRGGELFPHLYGELDPGLAKRVWGIKTGSDGVPDIPKLMEN